MPKPEIHPAACRCHACTPIRLHGGAQALGIAGLTLVLVIVTLLAVWAGLRLETLSYWS